MKLRNYTIVLFILFIASRAYAGDTLTRAEIYNFNVGDTFDYRIYNQQPVLSTSYSRYTISAIEWSADSLTKYIVRMRLYPSPLILDTMIISDLSAAEVILDSITAIDSPTYCRNPSSYIIDSLDSFFGKKTNSCFYSFCSVNWWGNKIFASGLGVVSDNRWGGQLMYSFFDSTLLVYYSGDSGTYGMPYTSFPTGVTEMNANNKVKLYPTLTDGNITIEAPDVPSLPFDLTIYDLQGKIALQMSVDNKKKIIQLPSLEDGLYFWRVNAESISGKLILAR